MKVLVTGGAGFIGSHVVDKLIEKGIDVRIFDMVMPNYRNDIEFYQGSLLDLDALRMAFNRVDAVFHLGAVADVKDVFQEPHYSEAVNVRGTINVLECIRVNDCVQVGVIITSDKCYKNVEWVWGYRENDQLGGDDPYSASKGCAEIAINSYCQSFFNN